jgi:hypothetical protein
MMSALGWGLFAIGELTLIGLAIALLIAAFGGDA